MAHDHDNHEDGVSRRHALECMLWAGTGVLCRGRRTSFRLIALAKRDAVAICGNQ